MHREYMYLSHGILENSDSKGLPEFRDMAESVKMNNGALVPTIGLGTWQSEKEKAGQAVQYALEIGYTHIDCAHSYQNEGEIGEYLANVFKSGKVKRENVFIVSKLWCKDFAKEDVIKACELTLKNLQLDYLDLYLMHLPYRLEKTDHVTIPQPKTGVGLIGYSKELVKETWQQMEILVERGLCKAIGISNFTTQKIGEMLEFAKIVPACNQVELHPYLPQNKLKKYCDEKGIILVAFSPLGNPTRPAMFVGEKDPVLLEDPVITEVAKKHKCSVAQVLISWSIHRGIPVIPKSVTPSRILENLESKNVKLDDDDMAKINAISTRHRYVAMAWAQRADQTLEDLWDNEYLG